MCHDGDYKQIVNTEVDYILQEVYPNYWKLQDYNNVMMVRKNRSRRTTCFIFFTQNQNYTQFCCIWNSAFEGQLCSVDHIKLQSVQNIKPSFFIEYQKWYVCNQMMMDGWTINGTTMMWMNLYNQGGWMDGCNFDL